jgi:glutamate dehydrogenase/leucine dehydrogenase
VTHLEQILTRVNKAAKIINLDDKILGIVQTFKTQWECDIKARTYGDKKDIFKVIRVWHRSPYTRTPHKGGMRYHMGVNMDMMKSHAVEMSLKFWLSAIFFGGAKGGLVIDPSKHSPQELKNITEAWVKEMSERGMIGPFRDVLAPDIGTNPEVMGWINESYGYIQRQSGFAHTLGGAVTGKPISQSEDDFHSGGLTGRLEATGYGLTKALANVMELKKLNKSDFSRVAIMGFGNVGKHAAQFLSDDGYKIVALSDVDGGMLCENGIDNATLKKIRSPQDIEHGQRISNEELLELDVDILVPAAIENVITEDNADNIKAKIILEGANGPTTPEADEILENKNIFVIPDLYANSGGGIVSFFEWCRDVGKPDERLPRASRGDIKKEEVLDALTDMMGKSGNKIFEQAQIHNVSLRLAAYILALQRVTPLLQKKYYV